MTDANNLFFDVGDKTALVCVDNIEHQNPLVEALTEMEFKVHVGVFLEDISAKMSNHTYDILIIADNFMGATMEDNPVLKTVQSQPMGARRSQLTILLSESLATADKISGFIYSVGLTLNPADISQLQVLVRKTLAENEEFYRTFKVTGKQL
ncbi:MAG: hypothetical protein SFY92_02575 [Verrucomicrobiae bacterium]|nr:hypothetical protein [Verrucomicrobiae bacterium]